MVETYLSPPHKPRRAWRITPRERVWDLLDRSAFVSVGCCSYSLPVLLEYQSNPIAIYFVGGWVWLKWRVEICTFYSPPNTHDEKCVTNLPFLGPEVGTVWKCFLPVGWRPKLRVLLSPVILFEMVKRETVVRSSLTDKIDIYYFVFGFLQFGNHGYKSWHVKPTILLRGSGELWGRYSRTLRRNI